MTENLFHCLKCNKNRRAKAMRSVRKPGAIAGVSMDYYTARCPVCGSRMMKIKDIFKVSKSKR